MDFPRADTRHLVGNGDLVTHQYHGVQPDSMATSDAMQVGDNGMDQLFDFQGYQTDSVAAYFQPEPSTARQEYVDSQNYGYMDSDQPEEGDDDGDDGWPALFQAAYEGYYSVDPLKSWLIPLQPSSFNEDLIMNGATTVEVEKWDIDQTTMEFLASLVSASASGDSLRVRCGLRACIRDIKIEEPVLQSDAATDMLRLQERNIIHLTSKGIKPFPLDEQHDQALQWSAKSSRLPHELDQLLAAERMTVNSETGTFLMEVFEDTKGDLVALLSEDRHCKVTYRLSFLYIWSTNTIRLQNDL